MSQPDADPNCIFCKIAAGQIPCYKLYEDERVLAFLDNGPLSEGHSLIIPKRHAETIDALPEDDAAACMRIVPRLSRAVCQAVGAEHWNLLQNNGKLAHQAVPHVHFHLIPRFEDAGLGIEWRPRDLDPDRAKALAEQVGTDMQVS